jgi:hypothetical protein
MLDVMIIVYLFSHHIIYNNIFTMKFITQIMYLVLQKLYIKLQYNFQMSYVFNIFLMFSKLPDFSRNPPNVCQNLKFFLFY